MPYNENSDYGLYQPLDGTVTATVLRDNSNNTYVFGGGYTVMPGGQILSPDGTEVRSVTVNGGLTTITQGEETITSLVNGDLVCDSVMCGGVLIKRTVTLSTRDGANIVRRKRVTEMEYNSDGTRRISTTLYGYYGSGDYAGNLKFIVQPAGIARYLANGHLSQGVAIVSGLTSTSSCPLDQYYTVTDETLLDYASVYCEEYDESDRVTKVSGEGGACCGGGSGPGTYEFAYGPASPTGTGWNTWRTWRRILAPNGLQTVEFINQYGRIVYNIVQDSSNTRWVTHYIYDTKGRVTEHRYPSACMGYTFPTTETDEDDRPWVTSVTADDAGTTGLVRLYSYDDSHGGNLKWEKVRKGTSPTTNPAHYVRWYEYVSH